MYEAGLDSTILQSQCMASPNGGVSYASCFPRASARPARRKDLRVCEESVFGNGRIVADCLVKRNDLCTCCHIIDSAVSMIVVVMSRLGELVSSLFRGHPAVVYDYSPTRASHAFPRFLEPTA